MKEYNYKSIKRFDKSGIELKDGYIIKFDECRMNWANSRKISYVDSVCVADRFFSNGNSYFIFYTNERIKIVFMKSIFPWDTKYRKRFLEIQMVLNHYGYSSYDCS